MSSVHQDELQRLRPTGARSDWFNRTNAWVRELSTRELSSLATDLLLQRIGGERTRSNEAGYKLVSEGRRIEVRVSTLSRINGYPSLAWTRISLSDPFTHLGLVAIFPDDVKVFLVEKSSIPNTAVKQIKSSPGYYQIVTTRAFNLDPWFQQAELG